MKFLQTSGSVNDLICEVVSLVDRTIAVTGNWKLVVPIVSSSAVIFKSIVVSTSNNW